MLKTHLVPSRSKMTDIGNEWENTAKYENSKNFLVVQTTIQPLCRKKVHGNEGVTL